MPTKLPPPVPELALELLVPVPTPLDVVAAVDIDDADPVVAPFDIELFEVESLPPPPVVATSSHATAPSIAATGSAHAHFMFELRSRAPWRCRFGGGARLDDE